MISGVQAQLDTVEHFSPEMAPERTKVRVSQGHGERVDMLGELEMAKNLPSPDPTYHKAQELGKNELVRVEEGGKSRKRVRVESVGPYEGNEALR